MWRLHRCSMRYPILSMALYIRRLLFCRLLFCRLHLRPLASNTRWMNISVCNAPINIKIKRGLPPFYFCFCVIVVMECFSGRRCVFVENMRLNGRGMWGCLHYGVPCLILRIPPSPGFHKWTSQSSRARERRGPIALPSRI